MLFPVKDFVVPPPPGCTTANVTEGLSGLEEIITTSVRPDSWGDVGGAGEIAAIDRWGLMVIAQSDEAFR